MGLWARKHHARADVEIASEPRKLFARAIGADHQQERSARDQRPCFNQEAESLSRESIADEDHHSRARGYHELLANRCAFRLIAAGGPEPYDIDALVKRHRIFLRE